MADPKKYLSKIVKDSDTLWLKDAEARQMISDIESSITGAMHYVGITSTTLIQLVIGTQEQQKNTSKIFKPKLIL